MKGKKAQLVEGVLIVIAILLVIQSMVAVVSHKNIIEQAINTPSEALDFF